jgi:hypothetical protein
MLEKDMNKRLSATMILKKYNVESTKDLTKVQYEEMTKGFESLANKEDK